MKFRGRVLHFKFETAKIKKTKNLWCKKGGIAPPFKC